MIGRERRYNTPLEESSRWGILSVWGVPVSLAILTLAGLLASQGILGDLVRPWIVFLFMLIAPGLAWVRLIGMRNNLAELILGIALSMALSSLISEWMVITDRWDTSQALVLLAVIALFGVGFQVLRELKSRMNRRSIRRRRA